MVTFTLEPHRGEGAVGEGARRAGPRAGRPSCSRSWWPRSSRPIGGAPQRVARTSALDDVGKYVLLQVSGVLQGLAFGLLFLNSAAAIVTYFVLPIAFSILTSVWSALHDVAAVDRPRHLAAAAVQTGEQLTGEQWAQLLVGHPHLGGAAVRWSGCGGCCAPR